MQEPTAPAADVLRGDPARHVLGPPEEQPARVHAPLAAKPWSEARLRTELGAYVDEQARRLAAARKALHALRAKR